LNGSIFGEANSSQQPINSLPTLEDKPPLFKAIQEQLGLKIEPRKAPVEVLVIDHLDEQPAAN
jgi:uncharacterized protein (TIGR03435 family)